jgi:hypothetical protein
MLERDLSCLFGRSAWIIEAIARWTSFAGRRRLRFSFFLTDTRWEDRVAAVPWPVLPTLLRACSSGG